LAQGSRTLEAEEADSRWSLAAMAKENLAGFPGGLSADSYLDRHLRASDGEHYSAAGVLFYRRRAEALEFLLAWERPWNSFISAYDELSWNILGGKRIPRVERSTRTTAIRIFLESCGQSITSVESESLRQNLSGGFCLWYALGKFAVHIVEIPEDALADLPERFAAARGQQGPTDDFVITSSGAKRWTKQVEAFEWVPAYSLTPPCKAASDLLVNIVQVTALKNFLSGSLDLETAFPPSEVPGPHESWGGKGSTAKGKGKGVKGKMKGKGKGKAKDMPPIMYGGQAVYSQGFAPTFQVPQTFHSPAEVQRQLYGEQLLVLVQAVSPSPYLAQKITGMLLELPEAELVVNFTDRAELRRRVDEALEVLREDGFV